MVRPLFKFSDSHGSGNYHFSPQKENNNIFSLSRQMREISTVRSESVRLIENA